MTTFPVLASTLSAKALEGFIQEKYTFLQGASCSLFRTGINHTYFLSTTNEKYVVRVYCHNWRTLTEIKEELHLLEVLRKERISVATPIADDEGAYIQDINAPEGIRYVVVFTYAKGEKLRFMSNDTCATMGSLIAKMHLVTAHKRINRITYTSEVLLHQAYTALTRFFSEEISEMKFLKKLGKDISTAFQNANASQIQQGVVHLDIWYDNVSVLGPNEITIFDFDNCGNGALLLDVGYFCMQLFCIESDKSVYEIKVQHFLKGYQKERKLSAAELELLPVAGAAIFTFYLGIQAQRFDWSNIFLTENYLKMFVGRIRTWLDYYETKTFKDS